MTTKTLNAADLDMFTGSETYYRHALNHKVIFTEGAHYVAETGGAFWLLDEIALIQPHDARVAAEEFQVWKLTVRPSRSATLVCEDGNHNVVFSKEIIPELEDSMTEFFSGYNLANERLRDFYNALMDDTIQSQPFWPEFKKSATRRNKFVHEGKQASEQEAADSLKSCSAFVEHVSRFQGKTSP